MLTRGTVLGGNPDAITEVDHEVLDTLTHRISESSFEEELYTGDDLTTKTLWATPAKLLKIREHTYTYLGDELIGVVAKQYDDAGNLLVTLTKTLAYTGDVLNSVTRVRS